MSLPSAILSDIPGLTQIMGGLARGALISGLIAVFLLPPFLRYSSTSFSEGV